MDCHLVSWYHAASSTFRLEHSLVYYRASKATPAPILSATKRRAENCHSVLLFFDILISWSNLHRVWRSWELISDVSSQKLLTYPEFWGYQDVACWLVQWWTSCESCHSIFHHPYRREVWPKQWHLLGLWRHVRKIWVVVFRPFDAWNLTAGGPQNDGALGKGGSILRYGHFLVSTCSISGV